MGLILESLLLELVVVSVCLFLAVYLYFKRAYRFWKEKNVPHLEPSFPFGNFAEGFLFKKHIGIVLMDFYQRLEGNAFGGTYFVHKPWVLIRDPELIKTVLVKDFSSFHDRGIYLNEEVDPLTAHLFFLSGVRWRNLRVKLSPTFTSGKMKMMFNTLVECGTELQRCVEKFAINEEEIELKDVLARYGTDVISSVAFGIQCNCLKNPDAEFRQWGKKVFSPSVKQALTGFLMNVTPGLIKYFKIPTLDPEMSKYFLNMVKETVDYREKNNVQRKDFLQLLIQLKNNGIVDPDHEDEEGVDSTPITYNLTMENLAAQAFVFFVAGFETSSSTKMWCLYELALNPDIQDRVRKEILEVLEKHGGKITYEAIQEMHYLDKVVSETLRKYPPVAVLNRATTKDYTMPGTDVVVDEGIPTLIPVLALHYDPKYYPDPEKFDPERFSEEEKEKRHPYVYLPFGEGPRICIGMRFGLLQTKVGLVSLLSKYQFNVGKKTQIPMKLDIFSFVLTALGGMWLQIKKCP